LGSRRYQQGTGHLLIKYNGDVIPCCYYRFGNQYAQDGNAMPIGNVFETGVWNVWNSPKYRELRKIVSNPEKAGSQPDSEESFCHGCPQIYETDCEKNVLSAEKHRFEDLYSIEVPGRPARRQRVHDMNPVVVDGGRAERGNDFPIVTSCGVNSIASGIDIKTTCGEAASLAQNRQNGNVTVSSS
jgi:hypothetical protein